MTFLAFTDGTKKKFKLETSIVYKAKNKMVGKQRICLSGGVFVKQTLYYTASLRWVLHTQSQVEWVAESVKQISLSEAALWLLQNGYTNGDIPDIVADIFVTKQLPKPTKYRHEV